MGFCSNCGTGYNDGAKFCPGCGATLEGQIRINISKSENVQAMPQFQAQPQPEKPQKKEPVFALFALITMLLSCVGLGMPPFWGVLINLIPLGFSIASIKRNEKMRAMTISVIIFSVISLAVILLMSCSNMNDSKVAKVQEEIVEESENVIEETLVEDIEEAEPTFKYWRDAKFWEERIFEIGNGQRLIFPVSGVFQTNDNGYCAVPVDDYVTVVYGADTNVTDFADYLKNKETTITASGKEYTLIDEYEAFTYPVKAYEYINGNAKIQDYYLYVADQKLVIKWGMTIDDDDFYEYDYEEAFTYMMKNVEKRKSPGNEVRKEPETSTDNNKVTSGGVDPELVAFLDSYEAFMDEYVIFMKKYMANSGNLALLSQYASIIESYNQFVNQANSYDSKNMSEADAAYYLKVMTRVEMKLLSIYG